MNDDNKNNILQFPARKKEAENPPAATVNPTAEKPKKAAAAAKGSKKTVAGSVLAIMLVTVAVNKYTFQSVNQSEMASNGGAGVAGRQIASVDHAFVRDAQWEKQLANRLASTQARAVASSTVGRNATIEEKLRWGILEEKYTITYSAGENQINTILLQDPVAKPSYILDRPKFLNEYGSLFESNYNTAKLKSVQKSEDKTVESYTLFDKENKPKGEARFELDRHKRLISLKVEPVQI